jgi:hypothetical protein
VQFLTEEAKENRFAILRQPLNSGGRDAFGGFDLYCFLTN